jgi:predicted RNase H-like HicB family nuclease
MEKQIEYTFWIEKDGTYLGYINNYPDQWTQGNNLEDLLIHLKDLYELLKNDDVPGVRKVDTFLVSE